MPFFLLLIISLCVLSYQIYKLIHARRLAKQDTKILDFLAKAPRFSPQATNNYIKLSGYLNPVSTQNQQPYNSYKIFAEWQYKKKKPKKGMETASKLLYQYQPTQELSLTYNEIPVFFNPAEFEKNGLCLIPEKIHSVRTCPPEAIVQDQRRYTNYKIIEKQLHDNEQVTLYAKLIQKQGRFTLVPTGNKNFPSIFCLGGQKVINDFFLKQIKQYYKKRSANWVLVIIFSIVLLFALKGLAM